MSNDSDKNTKAFWQVKDLRDMNDQEWESLCDRCGRCCLNKLDCEETNKIYFTNASCKLLNLGTGQCSNYKERKKFVSDCINLTSGVVRRMSYLPETCAYRLLAEGKKLFDWHPLISGTDETVKSAGISVTAHKIVNEVDVEDLDDYIINWMKPLDKK